MPSQTMARGRLVPRMRIVIVRYSLALLIWLVPTRPGNASTVVPMDLRQLTKAAGVIFIGTVSSVRSEWTERRTAIITRVAFDRVTTIKGHPPPGPIQLALSGGTVGKDQIITEGQPQFRVGGRYVLLCRSTDFGSERNAYLPILGLYEGFFQIHDDKRSGRMAVHDWADRPVTAIEDGRLVMVAAGPAPGGHGQIRPRAVDLDVYRAGDRAKRDSLPARLKEGEGPPKQSPRPNNRQRPSTQDRPITWEPGSQRIEYYNLDPIRLVEPENDLGSRLSEGDFVNAIRSLMAR